MIRKILAVVAGYTLWSLLWIASTTTLQSVVPGAFDESGGTRSVGILLTILVVSIVLSVLAGWVSVAITRTQKTALWTGALLLATGIPIQIGYWELMPVWYHLSFLACLFPATVLGGTLPASPRGVPVTA